MGGETEASQPRDAKMAWQRVYQAWSGNVIFCCWGRCVTAYPGGPTVCAWTFILVPCGFYCLFAARLWNDWYALVPIAAGLMFFITTTLLCLTCCSDPGVIPRRKLILSAGLERELSELLGYDVLGKGQPTGQLDVDSNAMVPEDLRRRGYKWCRTCQVVRPPRSSHCPDCDQCVLRYDHHCPFVNNCIGQRNYHFFVGFVSSVVCLALVVLPGLVWCILTPSGAESETPTEEASSNQLLNDALVVAVIVVASLAGLVCLALVVFLGYHSFLIASGMTTKEHLGKSKTASIGEEPTLWAARGPRLFDPRAFIQVEMP